MTAEQIYSIRADVEYIYIEKQGFYHVQSHTNDSFITLYEGADPYSVVELDFDTLSETEGVTFFKLTPIELDT